MTREAVTGAQRVVVKVGSSSLTTAPAGSTPTGSATWSTAWPAYASRGADLVLVSSGAIAAGLSPLAFKRRPRDLARQQAAASVGQGLLVHRYTEEFARHGQVTGQVLLTVDDVTRRSHYRNAQRTFAKLLELGVVPIVNENDTVATYEIRFGDNDRLAALVAHLVHADLLVLLSDVDGLYDAPPSDRRAAGSIPEVDRRGRARAASASAAPGRPESAPAACTPRSRRPGSPPAPASRWCSPTWCTRGRRWQGEQIGTLFHPTGRRRPTRLLWLAHATEPKGRVVAGRRAPCAPSRSGGRRCCRPASPRWRAASSPATRSTWWTRRGQVVARGLVNYDARELPGLLGRSTRELARELGPAYEREVVHRDDLIVL